MSQTRLEEGKATEMEEGGGGGVGVGVNNFGCVTHISNPTPDTHTHGRSLTVSGAVDNPLPPSTNVRKAV